MSVALKKIQSLLRDNSTEEGRIAHRRFVPGTEKIYGVRMPVLNQLSRQFSKDGFTIVEELWDAGALEEKILAIKILERISKEDPERSLKIVQQFAKNIGNWAVCDAIGMQGLKKILPTHREQIFALARKYNQSKDLWQRRLSLVLVEWYTRKKELHTEIMPLVKALENDEEYYVKKVVVWIKRNFEKGK